MKKLFLLLIASLMFGCGGSQPVKTITEIQTVKIKIPSELLVIPEKPELPANGANNNDLAVFIVKSEQFSDVLIGQIEAIKEINK
jgi:hypothetical protein